MIEAVKDLKEKAASYNPLPSCDAHRDRRVQVGACLWCDIQDLRAQLNMSASRHNAARDVIAFRVQEDAEIRASLTPLMAMFGVSSWGSNAFALTNIANRVKDTMGKVAFAATQQEFARLLPWLRHAPLCHVGEDSCPCGLTQILAGK